MHPLHGSQARLAVVPLQPTGKETGTPCAVFSGTSHCRPRLHPDGFLLTDLSVRAFNSMVLCWLQSKNHLVIVRSSSKEINFTY